MNLEESLFNPLQLLMKNHVELLWQELPRHKNSIFSRNVEADYVHRHHNRIMTLYKEID